MGSVFPYSACIIDCTLKRPPCHFVAPVVSHLSVIHVCMHVQAAAEQIAQAPNEPCANFAKTFADCMSDNNGDLEGCRYYFDKLQVLKHPAF